MVSRDTETHEFSFKLGPKFFFQKILIRILLFEIAKKEKVDFVLLGGDLFDINEPNIGIMNQAIAIFIQGKSPNSFSDWLVGLNFNLIGHRVIEFENQ